jgi:AraC family transcriptional regulator
MADNLGSSPPNHSHGTRLELPNPRFPGRSLLHVGREASLYCDEPPPIYLEEHRHEQLQVSFQIDPAICIITRRGQDGTTRDQRLTGRQVYLVAPGVPHAVRWETKAVFLAVYYEKAFLARHTPEDVAALLAREVLPAAAEDAVLWLLITTLRTLTTERDDPPVGLLESIMLSLGRRLLTRYGQRAAFMSSDRGRLSPGRYRSVTDYIRANMHKRIRVAELADIVHIGTAHFTEVFGNTTGMAPMEYVREARFVRAHELALGCEHRFSEIADACGFSDGSHLNREFKKFFGYPARRLRFRWTAESNSENA